MDDHVEVVQQQWWHARTGRRVDLVGMMRAGAPDYYRDVVDELVRLGRGGAVVLCEAPTYLPVPSDVTPDELTLLDHMRQLNQIRAAQAHALGWVAQDSAMPPLPSLTVADVPIVEVMRSGELADVAA